MAPVLGTTRLAGPYVIQEPSWRLILVFAYALPRPTPEVSDDEKKCSFRRRKCRSLWSGNPATQAIGGKLSIFAHALALLAGLLSRSGFKEAIRVHPEWRLM